MEAEPGQAKTFPVYAYLVRAKPALLQKLGVDLGKDATVVPSSDGLRLMHDVLARPRNVAREVEFMVSDGVEARFRDVTNWNYVCDIHLDSGQPGDIGEPAIGSFVQGLLLRVCARRDGGDVVYTEIEALGTKPVRMCWFSVPTGTAEGQEYRVSVTEPVVLRISRRLDVPAGLRVRMHDPLVVPLRPELLVRKSDLRRRIAQAERERAQDETAEFLLRLDPRGYPLREMYFLVLQAEPRPRPRPGPPLPPF